MAASRTSSEGPARHGARARHRPAPVPRPAGSRLRRARAAEAGRAPSLQFFDGAGEAVHKIYATDETDRQAFDALIARYTRRNAGRDRDRRRAPPTRRSSRFRDRRRGPARRLAGDEGHARILRPAGQVQGRPRAGAAAGRRGLRPRAAGARAALRLRGRSRRRHADHDLRRQPAAASRSIPARSSAWSTRTAGSTCSIPTFNLHLRDEGVARVFSVRKPTEDGIVTSIEAFDAHNRNILLMFGARKPGKPELEEWRTIVANDREAGGLVIERRTSAVAPPWRCRVATASPLRPAQQTPPRIVSVGSSITEIIYALGAENLLVGVDTTSLYPERRAETAAGRLHARSVGRRRAVAEADPDHRDHGGRTGRDSRPAARPPASRS